MVAMVSINYLAVLVSAIASMVLGSLWFGPLFGKQWMALMKFDKKTIEEAKKKGMGAKIWVILVISVLITSYVLAHFVDYLEATTVTAALQAAFWLWLGFI